MNLKWLPTLPINTTSWHPCRSHAIMFYFHYRFRNCFYFIFLYIKLKNLYFKIISLKEHNRIDLLHFFSQYWMKRLHCWMKGDNQFHFFHLFSKNVHVSFTCNSFKIVYSLLFIYRPLLQYWKTQVTKITRAN